MSDNTNPDYRSALPETLGYEEARLLARDEDPAVRRALARHKDTQPEILYYLAEDSDPDVRLGIAGNERAPRQADKLLSSDTREDVRAELANKVGRLTPQLTSEDQGKLANLTLDILENLAKDQAVLVRQFLSEALKDVTNAPHSVIFDLAMDQEHVVSGPVLQFSPVLTDDDLISIIQSRPVQAALASISRRSEVPSGVADAIVASGDEETISVLLENPSAQIREETLDALVDRAETVNRWHAPLVRRPILSAHAARHLAGYVAVDLLDQLRQRSDLSEETLAAVADIVSERLDAVNLELPGAVTSLVEPEWAQDTVDEEELDRLFDQGNLLEPMILDALSEGRKRFVEAAIAKRAGIPVEMVIRAVSQSNAKAIVALVWKAGLSPVSAGIVQTQLAGIPPSAAVLAEDPAEWPLSEADMDWQFEFFSEP